MDKKATETQGDWAPFNVKELGLLCGGLLLLMLPFMNKAYHVDDPLFVWTAKQVLEDPLNFYGFYTNWGRSLTYMYEIMQNPPLLSYYLAPFGAVLGWSEPVMHLAMLLPTLLCCAGMYMASRRFCNNPMLATLLVAVSPGFLVSSAQVMSDVPMVGCWAWALYFWMRGLDEDRIGLTLAGAVLIAAGALTKYFAFSLVPLMLVYTLLAHPTKRNHLYCLLVPLVTLIGFEFLCNRLYGVGLLSDATRFASASREEYGASVFVKTQVSLVFAGGSLAAMTLLVPVLWPRREALIWLGIFAGVLILNFAFSESRVLRTVFQINIENPGEEIVSHVSTGPTLLHHLQWALWTVGGLQIAALAVSDLMRRRDPESLMLALWIGGTFFFVITINHFVNARVILPMGLAVSLLAMRKIEDRFKGLQIPEVTFRAVAGIATATLLVSLMLNYVDYRLAGSAREAAGKIMGANADKTVWFSGHSGWQYYMEELGGKPIDQKRDSALPGDVYVLPSNNWQPIPVNPSLVKDHYHETLPVPRWATTSHYQVYAGFYSDGAGPLPFYFGPVPEEVYLVVNLGEIREL